jgi:cytochrome c biogenesis protein CcdA
MMRDNKKLFSLIFLFVLILSNIHFAHSQESPRYETAVIYYNEACTMCASYIKQELVPTLEEVGIKNIIKKDYVNEKKNRVELNKLNKEHNIAPDLQGHFVVFIDNKIILGGHVPKHVIVDLLTKDTGMDKILVLQDEMRDAVSYFAWGFKGDAKEYELSKPISEYIDWFNENEAELKEPEPYSANWNFSKLFPLVLISGILDGLNPCAFAVLLFFVAFLFTIKRATKDILKVGFVYILMIYIAYLLIGLGLVHAFIFSGQEHLMARISAYLVILLGLINIKDYFWYGKGISLSPKINTSFYKRWLHKLTIPSVMLVGFLVGLCTFPCSGGIYVAIIGMLTAKTTYLIGLYYILFYNLMFVLPLIVTLFFLTNRRTVGYISRWETSHKKVLKLIMGIVMIIIGIVILVWFI